VYEPVAIGISVFVPLFLPDALNPEHLKP